MQDPCRGRARLIRGRSRSHEPAKARRDGDGDDLQVVHAKTVRVRDDDERSDRRRNRRARDAHLRCDGSDAAWALGTDALFKGDVADDRHEGIDHMARTHEYREEERAKWGEERNVVRVLAQKPLGQLNQPIHAARRLHHACARDRSDDDVDNIGRRLPRCHANAEYQNGKADSRDGTQGETSVTGAYVKSQKDHQKFQNHRDCHALPLNFL